MGDIATDPICISDSDDDGDLLKAKKPKTCISDSDDDADLKANARISDSDDIDADFLGEETPKAEEEYVVSYLHDVI